MIKLLKNKLFISMFLLVICVFITSSCFATELSEQYSQYYVLGGSISDLGISTYEYDGSWPVTNLKYGYFKVGEKLYCYMVDGSGDKLVNFKKYTKMWLEGVSGVSCHIIEYDFSTNTWGTLYSTSGGVECTTLPITVYSETEYSLYLSDGTLVYDYEEIYSKASTDFDYTLKGVSRNELELAVSNLDSSYSIVGFVDNPTEFSVGDTLNVSSYVNYLRLVSFSDSSVYTCSLYPGETLKYYILDENKTVVDIGVIDELSNGYFLYSYVNEIYKGIDYVFLKNGSFYWDNTLDFVWTDPNGYQYHDNQIITILSKVIKPNFDVYSYTVKGTVYDADSNILGQSDCTYIQFLNSFDASIVDTHYSEYNSTPVLGVFSISNIQLSGTDNFGNRLDFSNYYIKWNVDSFPISYAVNSENIFLNNSVYSTTSGIFTNITTSGLCLFNLKYEKRLSNYSCFRFTFDIYNSNNELVKTIIISSDDIAKNQINFDNSNGNNSDYDIKNNPNYGNWTSDVSPDVINNWKIDDFKNYLGTGNFIWQFFRSILFGFPSWLTIPIYILLSGVVVISLIKFLRGG